MPPRGDHYATVATATDVPQAAVWTLWLMRSNNDKLWLIGGGVLFILYTMGGGNQSMDKCKTARQRGHALTSFVKRPLPVFVEVL